jgi:hypothetical protein
MPWSTGRQPSLIQGPLSVIRGTDTQHKDEEHGRDKSEFDGHCTAASGRFALRAERVHAIVNIRRRGGDIGAGRS